MAESNLAPKGAARAPSRRAPLHGVRGGGAAAPLELDRLIHERMRLAIVSALAVNESLSFNELKRLLETTDGNLSVHARKLEEAGYVVCTKSFEGRVPRTEYRLSAAGRRALERYLDHMEALIRAHPRALSRLFFLRSNFMQQSTSHSATPPPIHVGIIMDGNGRWATGQGRSRVGRPSRGRGDGAAHRRGGARTAGSACSRCSRSPPTTGAARRPRSAG